MNDPKAKPDQQAKTDLVDNRRGAYDPVSKDGMPQSTQVTEALPGDEDILPEGLKRPRVGPDHKPVGK